MNMWDQEFDTPEFVYGTEANDFLKASFQALPKGKILCLAEGEGRNAVFLAQQGYEVTAVDFSQVGLEKARKLAQQRGVHIETIFADLNHFDPGEQQWDGIVSIYCHLPSAVRKPLYQRVIKALKNNGVFLLEGYTPQQLNYKTGGPPDADMMTSANTLERELGSLTFSHLLECEREVHEGINHTGLAAVIQGVAHRKH